MLDEKVARASRREPVWLDLLSVAYLPATAGLIPSLLVTKNFNGSWKNMQIVLDSFHWVYTDKLDAQICFPPQIT